MPQIVFEISGEIAAQSSLLALNNAHARETSELDAARFRRMIASATVATHVAPAAAFLLAFDQACAYDGGHFLWFRDRLDRFVYIDRVVVGAAFRRQGLGRLLYLDLFARAAKLGHHIVTCEVNRTPANPVSDAFHAELGFQPVGEAAMPNSSTPVSAIPQSPTPKIGKVVRYLVRHG